MSEALTILTGDCREVLKMLPDESVNCCVTSPPYWGLRDYGTAQWEGGEIECDHLGRSQTSGSSTLSEWKTGGGTRYKETAGGMPFGGQCGKCGALRVDKQIGLEKTFEEYIKTMVAVFEEVRRVLRKDGTCWINLGDSYNTGTTSGRKPTTAGKHGYWENPSISHRINANAFGLKPKDLVGIPWRVAFALQGDGWYLRQDIIWAKPNPMPESVTDRCTKSHEYLFLLSKSPKYYYDAAAIAEPLAYGSVERLSQKGIEDQLGSGRVPGKTNGNMKAVYSKRYTNEASKDFNGNGVQDASATKQRIVDRILSGDIITRNKRSVWTISTASCKDAHFATFPPDLVKPCILAGCPVGGVVLDPFLGSGTTAMVALELGRRAIGIELNAEYVKLCYQRCAVTPGLALA